MRLLPVARRTRFSAVVRLSSRPPRISPRDYDLARSHRRRRKTETVHMAGDDGSLYKAHLSKIPMFGSCTAEQLNRLAELGDVRTVTDSDDVVREGDKGGTFFVITSGSARVSRGDREVDTL